MFNEGIKPYNPLLWEIQRVYENEFSVGKKALELIEEETGLKLGESEAGNIALHFINAQLNSEDNLNVNATKVTKQINDVLDIVKYTFNIDIDDKSINYQRFMTHIRFFFQRLSKNQLAHSGDDFLLNQVKDKYRKSYLCAVKIGKYLGVDLGSEEEFYLTIHIQRITQR